MDQVYTIEVRPRVKVLLEGEGDSWSAYVPSIPGCIAAGASRKEVIRLIEEALTYHLEDLHDTAVHEAAETPAG